MTQDHGSSQINEKMTLVLEQKYRLLETAVSANYKLDERADNLIQIGSLVVGLLTIANLPGALVGSTRNISGLALLFQSLFILLSILTFVVLAIYYLWKSRPIPWSIAGSADWDRIYSDYIYSDTYFDQLLSDLLSSIKSAEERNANKARNVSNMIWFLTFQLGFVAIALIVGFLDFFISYF